jgi:CHAT domain-containing protein
LAACPGNRKSADEQFREIRAELRHGNIAAAKDHASRAVSYWRKQPQSDAYVRFRLLEWEAVLASGKAKDALAIVSDIRPRNAQLESQRQVDLGITLLSLGRFDESGADLDRAVAQSSNQDILLQVLVARSNLLANRGQASAAEQTARSALVLARELHDSYREALILNNLGFSLLRRSRYDQAIPYFERAKAAFDDASAERHSSMAAGNLALCYYRLGDFERALRMRMYAIAIQERLGALGNLQNSYGEVGNIYALQYDPHHAVPYYRRALDLALKLDSKADAARWAVDIAMAHAGLEEWAEARKFNLQAQRLNQETKGGLGPYIALNAAGVAAAAGDRNEAERRYSGVISSAGASPEVIWQAHAGLGRVYAGAGDRPRSNRQFEAALQLIETTRADLMKSDYQITFLSELIRFYQDYVDALIDQGEWKKALVVADSSRARVLAGRLRSQTIEFNPSSVQEFQRVARTAKTVILSYWLGPRRSLVWIVGGSEIRMVTLPQTASTIRDWVEAYRTEIERGLHDPIDAPSSAGWKLSAALLQPVLDEIPANGNVVIVPDGSLNGLNFETLPVRGPQPHYWIEQATVSVAPSIGLLTAPAREGPRHATQRKAPEVLLIGNAEAVAEFPKLAYAGREMQNIASHFRPGAATLLAGPDAAPPAYGAANPGRFSLIHFAAHAETSRESPLDSAVILSPVGGQYKLYARDVLDVPLSADLVTVSACRSAGERSFSGEGLVGFAWAFLHAGARDVIAGLWDVDDASTAQLMDGLYAGIQGGQSPSAALHTAKLTLLHSSGNFRKPYYWAPFQVYRRSAA